MAIKTTALILALIVACGTAIATTSNDEYCLSHEENTTFTAADGCNTCTCINQTAVCTEAVCVAPLTGDEQVQCRFNQTPVSGIHYVPHCAASAHPQLESTLQSEVVGCVDSGVSCIMVQQYAMGPDGDIYLFDSCIPDGFVPVQVDCAAINGVCTASQSPILATEKRDYCSMNQNSIQTVVGCHDSSTFCASVVTFAKDPSGKEWVFSDSCTPESFTPTKGNCNSISCPLNTQVIYGTPMSMYCSESTVGTSFSVPLGCTANTVCAEMVTYAKSPKGDIYVFSNACIPDRFRVVRASCNNDFVESGCLANQQEVMATPFEETCTQANTTPVSVGCVNNDLICPQVVTYAQDRQGIVYVFPNACVPRGFTVMKKQPTCKEVTGCISGAKPITAMSASSFCSVGAEATIETVGCMQSNIMCGSLPVFAVSPAGAVYYFPVGCVPMDYEVISTNCEDITAGESCVANTHAVTASPMANYCSDSTAAPNIAVGCVEDGSICTEAVTFAQNSQGQIYVFADGCIPAGFSVVDEQCAAACPNGFKSVEAVSVDDFCWSETVEDFSHMSFVGCVEEHTNCLMVETFAREKQSGEAYVFETGCVPSNYEILESVQSCHDMACYGNTCSQDGRVCQERVVECLTYPCPPETYCAESMCVGHEVYQEFVNDCGADCSCDEQGTATCGECDDKDESEWDAKVIAAGSVGVAAASAAVFVGYRKYFNLKSGQVSISADTAYKTMGDESA